MSERNWWRLSMAMSVVLVIVLARLWSHMNDYEPKADQLENNEDVAAYLEEHLKHPDPTGMDDPNDLTKIPTGIFIQSLKFFNSTEVNLTGYIWQRYTDGENDDFKPPLCANSFVLSEQTQSGGAIAGFNPTSCDVGFILPEQVQTGSDIDPREVYRIRQGNEEVIGWYFEATLRQPFNYFFYPFDHKTVWVRLWPKNFSENVVLVPDFKAYGEKTGLNDKFGLEKQIVLGTWEQENTYFNFKRTCYDTDFGINNYVGQTGFPELYYNIVINRKSGNAIIVYLLPLFLVAALLFSALLTVTGKPKLIDTHGFNTSGVLGTCSVLFFVVMLAHIQLREQFAGSSIVYMEYFYFLMYALLVAAAANTYLFSMRALRSLFTIHYKDNLIPKVLYWPITLLAMIAITVYVVWGEGLDKERAPIDKCSEEKAVASAYTQAAPATTLVGARWPTAPWRLFDEQSG